VWLNRVRSSCLPSSWRMVASGVNGLSSRPAAWRDLIDPFVRHAEQIIGVFTDKLEQWIRIDGHQGTDRATERRRTSIARCGGWSVSRGVSATVYPISGLTGVLWRRAARRRWSLQDSRCSVPLFTSLFGGVFAGDTRWLGTRRVVGSSLAAHFNVCHTFTRSVCTVWMDVELATMTAQIFRLI